MTTLATVRSYVRTHLDLDASELPDELVDEFIRDATHYVETFRLWPFLASTWSGATVAGQFEYPYSGLTNSSGYELGSVHAVLMQATGNQLRFRGHGLSSFGRSQSEPQGWGYWGDSLVFTPLPDAAYQFTVFGYRRPVDWVGNSSDVNSFGLPSDFASPLKTWALGRAYAHQEEGGTAVAYYDLAEFQLMNLAKRYATIFPFQGLRVNDGFLDDEKVF